MTTEELVHALTQNLPPILDAAKMEAGQAPPKANKDHEESKNTGVFFKPFKQPTMSGMPSLSSHKQPNAAAIPAKKNKAS